MKAAIALGIGDTDFKLEKSNKPISSTLISIPNIEPEDLIAEE